MAVSRARRSGISPETSPIKGRSLTKASGFPSPAKNVVATITGNTTATLSWSAPDISGDSAITGYEILGGGSASVSGTTATITGLSPNTSYSFSVVPINSVGRGKNISASSKTTTDIISASGGTVTDISDYNGSGETWRVHTFTSNGTFTVNDAGSESFRILVVGGGGGGNNQLYQGIHAGNRGGGGEVIDVTDNLAIGTYPVVRGGGGGNMANGADSTFHTYTGRSGKAGNGGSFPSVGGASGNGNAGGSSATYTGGGGGAGGPGSSTTNGPGVSSDISGSSITYGAGGAGVNGAPGSGGFGGPGGAGTSGAAGIVIIAYKIS